MHQPSAFARKSSSSVTCTSWSAWLECSRDTNLVKSMEHDLLQDVPVDQGPTSPFLNTLSISATAIPRFNFPPGTL